MGCEDVLLEEDWACDAELVVESDATKEVKVLGDCSDGEM